MDTDPDEGDSRPVACVTGAARGIGLAYVRALVRRGWRVAALDITGASEAVERLAADTGVGPKQLAPFTCDVSDHGERTWPSCGHRDTDA
jgi:NAD(P)-dependent dehydrogenase (short-subunit alcohol dehydrogenase family)